MHRQAAIHKLHAAKGRYHTQLEGVATPTTWRADEILQVMSTRKTKTHDK